MSKAGVVAGRSLPATGRWVTVIRTVSPRAANQAAMWPPVIGLARHEALQEVGAEAGELLGLLGRLHALGDGAEVEVTGEGDDRRGDLGVSVGKFGDERAVDLGSVRREFVMCVCTTSVPANPSSEVARSRMPAPEPPETVS